MKDKKSRIELIKKIVTDSKVRSQEDLLNKLKSYSVNVTQATLSRDMKSMRISRISDGKSGYFYSLPENRDPVEDDRLYIKDIIRGSLSWIKSGNLMIVHTIPGHANTVAFAIDRLDLDEIAGTIAGDDTILVIPADKLDPDDIDRKLDELIPGWEENR